ncbi:MAG: hypothetical protein LBV02_03405 [Bacteroidales bacterium]|jgi:hypothetical protein|nr:hypothetical protein [Bacteroidales bacterium]
MSSVQRVIGRIAAETVAPIHAEDGESYEMDELRTFCENKANECRGLPAGLLVRERVSNSITG